jgi:circadian clock protein KaiB
MGELHSFRNPAKSRTVKPTKAPYLLRLYTTGTTPRSTKAIQNLREICETTLKGQYILEVIDIYQEPGRASEADIIVAPTLIKQEPLPPSRMVGDLSDRKKLLSNLSPGSKSK